MKIHVWAPGLYDEAGGIETYSAALLRALASEDAFTVSVFSMHDRKGSLRANAPKPARTAGTGRIPLRLRAAGFVALLVARAVLGRPDLIITTHLHFSPLAAWLKRMLGRSYWVCLHGKESWQVQRGDLRRAIHEADLLLPVSTFTQDRVGREQGVTEERFRLLQDTFDPVQWGTGAKPQYLLQRHMLASEARVILTVGRLSAGEAYKGHDRVIRAMPEVTRQVPNARYLIVGEGDDRQRLERLTAEQGVRELVIFAGRIPDAELPDHYRLCDVFAMPSTGEGFGIVFLEAMACGKPVIGGTRDAAVDALRHGELGVLVDPDDPAELRDALIGVLTKEHQHPLIYHPEALRQKVIEYFGFEKFRQTLGDILAEKFPESRSSNR